LDNSLIMAVTVWAPFSVFFLSRQLCALVVLDGQWLGCFLSKDLFFLAQWEEYHTHLMRTFTGYLGVTEGQLASISVLLAAAVFGPDFWIISLKSFLPHAVTSALAVVRITTIGHALICLLVLSNSWLMYHNITAVFQHLRVHEQAREKRLGALRMLLPLLTLIISGYLYQETSAFKSHPWVALATLGGVFSHLTSQMIVRSLTHENFSLLQWTVIPLPFIVFNASLPSITGQKAILNEEWVLFAYFVFVVAAMWHFITNVIDEITKYLGIYCLRLGPRDNRPATVHPKKGE